MNLITRAVKGLNLKEFQYFSPSFGATREFKEPKGAEKINKLIALSRMCYFTKRGEAIKTNSELKFRKQTGEATMFALINTCLR